MYYSQIVNWLTLEKRPTCLVRLIKPILPIFAYFFILIAMLKTLKTLNPNPRTLTINP